MKRKSEGFSGQRIVVLPRGVVAAALNQVLLCDLLPTDIGFYPKAKGHFMERQVGLTRRYSFIASKDRGGLKSERITTKFIPVNCL
jgi:AraC family transcriptional regulator of arabinose operon